MEKPNPWNYRKQGRVRCVDIILDETHLSRVFYRTIMDHVEEICLGERYIHPSPGFYFINECYHGSYIDNWHGGIQTYSLLEAANWVAQAEHPEWGYELWMIDNYHG